MGFAQFLATAVLDRKGAHCQPTYRIWLFNDRKAHVLWCGPQEGSLEEWPGYEDVAAGTLRVKLPPKDLAEEIPPYSGSLIAPISEGEAGTFEYRERFNYPADDSALFFLILPSNHLPRAHEFKPVPDKGWAHKDRFVLIWFRKPDTEFSVTFEEVPPDTFADRALACSSAIQNIPKESAEPQSRLATRVGREGSTVRTILFWAADPSKKDQLPLGKEFREIHEKLRMAPWPEQFFLQGQWSVRPDDLSGSLLDEKPEIVHFSGHGTATGALCVVNQAGQVHMIQPDALADLFKHFTKHVRCVVLNACFTERQAHAIARYIDYVIGTKQEIDDEVAIAFSIGFYQALGKGREFEEAYGLGCTQIKLQFENFPEHLMPILIKKASL